MQTTETIQSDALSHVNKMTGGSSVYELRKLIEENEFGDAILLAKRIPQTTADAHENRLALIAMLSEHVISYKPAFGVFNEGFAENKKSTEKPVITSTPVVTDSELVNVFEKGLQPPTNLDSFVSIMSIAERCEDDTFMANGVKFSKNAMIEMIEKSKNFPIPFYASKYVNGNEEQLQIGEVKLELDSEANMVFGKVTFDHDVELENFSVSIFNELTSVITTNKSLNDLALPSYSANMQDEEHVDGVDCISFKIFEPYTELQKESLEISKSLTDEQKDDDDISNFEKEMNLIGEPTENSGSKSSKEV